MTIAASASLMAGLDKSMPEVPIAVEPPSLPADFAEECERQWLLVLTELLDNDFAHRAHHNASTYAQGCRGPLCRKAQREHPRRKQPNDVPVLTMREERAYDPVLEYFHTVAKYRILYYKLAKLEELRRSLGA